jgi:single-strand DNA-binding protein
MADLNKVLLIGRMGGKPEIKKTQAGDAVTRMRVATSYDANKGNGQYERETEWHSVIAFGKLAEQCAQFLDKGKLVYVEGTLRTSTWKDAQGQEKSEREVRARHVHFLSSKAGEDKAGQRPQQQASVAGVPF